MSEVISFRLDRNNPREAQALGVLKKGQEAGYSLRHVLTEALLALEAAAEDEQAVIITLTELTQKLVDLKTALDHFQGMDVLRVRKAGEASSETILADSFLLSVKEAAQPGLKLDNH
jgi:hypothetical protein